MEPHFLIHALAFATVIATIGFFVLFAASKAEGLLKAFGTVLGLWVLLLTGIIVVGGITASMFGGRPFGMQMMDDQKGPWMHRGWMHDGWGHMGPPPADSATPAKPAEPPKK